MNDNGSSPLTISACLQQGIHHLRTTSETPVLDTQVLLTHILKKDKAFLYSHPEMPLTDSQIKQWKLLCQRRQQGEPIAYLIEQKEFWSLTFKVNHYTLIPRPETELLVEVALSSFPEHQVVDCLDLGTGCGAIAIAIAKHRPDWKITATDLCPEALAIAQYNAQQHGTHPHFICSHWFDNIPEQTFDLIISNPPYIAHDDPHLCTYSKQHEPKHALFSEQQGLADIRAIIEQAKLYLKPGGYLLLEHGFQQSHAVEALLQTHAYKNISTHRDLTGIKRAILAQPPL